MRRGLFCWLVLVIAACVGAPGWARVTPAISADDVDWGQCQAFEGGRTLGAAPREALETLLGLRMGGESRETWSTGQVAGTSRYFRVAFLHPVELGTLCTTYGGNGSVFWFGASRDETVSYLKADAPYPGDVTLDDQWVTLPAGLVKTLPVGTRTRALRFAEHFPSAVATPSAGYTTPASEMGVTLLFKERYYPATNLSSRRSNGRGKGSIAPRTR